MILVVDDEPNLVDMISAVLSDEGYAVITASDGASALEIMLGGLRPCLTILDLMMPTMSGWQLRAEMLSNPRLSDIPVAIVSAFTTRDMADLRPAAVLEKPFSLDRIVQLADQHCGPGSASA